MNPRIIMLHHHIKFNGEEFLYRMKQNGDGLRPVE